MDFNEAKQLLKEAIDESETSSDILRIWVDKIYQKGKQDSGKTVAGNYPLQDSNAIYTKFKKVDDGMTQKEKKDILIAPVIGYHSWLCRYCYSSITEGQKVCDCCGYGIRWS